MSKKVSNELQAEVRRRRILYLHILYVFIPSDCPLWAVRALNYCADQFLYRQTPAPQDTHTHMQDWWKKETLYQRIRGGKVLGSICEILCVYSYKLTFIHTCAHTNEYLDSKIIQSIFGFVEHNASYHLYMHTSLLLMLASFCFRLTHTTQKPADSLIII